MNKTISIVGLGWLGEPLALSLHKKGYTIKGTTTSQTGLLKLAKHPFYVGKVQINTEHIAGDWDTIIEDTDILVINIPPKRSIENIEEIYPAQIQQIIEHTPTNIKVIFVSSTAAYGNAVLDAREDVICKPDKPSGHAVLKAEQLCQAYFKGNCTVLRFSGLIGPERHPGRFLAGKRELKNPNVPVNLIHQDDCIELIERIIEQGHFGDIINGAADKHPVREDFYLEAAHQLGLEAPTFLPSSETDFKIVSNQKSKKVLGMTYKYPDPVAIFHKDQMSPIAIVGAGPGAVDLLTVQAIELIKNAEVILHDNLVSDEIMRLNTSAEIIYVGRKYGDQSDQKNRQTNINESLHQMYKEGKKVVRLKSGDPYIFGRASEEAQYLTDHEVPFVVVPGISAALAAASICNIPITARGASNSVLICTAHLATNSDPQITKMANALKQGTVLAVYMGLKSLPQIVSSLIDDCQDDQIPINAVSNVSRPDQKIITSTLANIEKEIEKNELAMPVVFLIGAKAITHD
ncbi:uroporphyrinogen-III C-methyltransferase [Reichenbachiella versicolor]|uniref:uroporphyrinogen-III C-methyltransferase n=1 Tax=Reichenbachiella versicolor TaxID=1821036 RepID=UPI000D6E698A|nr:uroporphyrinogen-III C-methyltransferase [Reichenbachiella versicolor]